MGQDAKGAARRTIIATQMPPVPVIRSLYGEMIRALNGNLRPTARFYEFEIVANQLRMTIVAAGTHEALHVLRLNHRLRAAAQALTLRSRSVGIEALHYDGARLPAIISQRA
jgi:hypothetical protein